MNSISNTQETSEPVVHSEKGHRWFASRYDGMNRSMEKGFMSALRREHLSGLTGDVLEIGAGTGANFEHYPAQVRVVALEPDPFMLERATTKLRDLGRTNITLQRAPAELLPFPDASFDTFVSTLVLCTVHDVQRSLDEMRRVLRPGLGVGEREGAYYTASSDALKGVPTRSVDHRLSESVRHSH